MENVPAIFGDKNKEGFNIWKENLKEIKTDKTKNGISCFDLINYTNFASERKVYHLNSISPTITTTGTPIRDESYSL